MLNEKFTLKSGVKIPAIAFGTWQIPDGEEAYGAVLCALREGYRHIDTAYAYGNEKSVGRAIADSGIPREEIFVTTKLPSDVKTYDGTRKCLEASLSSLGLDYVDLYLIHAPWPWSNVGQNCDAGNAEAWRAMTELRSEGKIRAIGVSNFHVRDIENLVSCTGIFPEVNKIRYFVGNTQSEITEYCQAHGILVEAYSPLATGALVGDAHLASLAEKYNKSIPKLCIRFCIENGTLPIPKSKSPERIKDNLDVDFRIEREDMDYLNSLYHIGPTKEMRS